MHCTSAPLEAEAVDLAQAGRCPRTGHAGAPRRGACLSGHDLDAQAPAHAHAVQPSPRRTVGRRGRRILRQAIAGRWAGRHGARASRGRACRTPPMHPIAPRSVSEQRLTAIRPWEWVLIEIQVQILYSHVTRHLREMPVCRGSRNSVPNETTWPFGRRRNTNAYLQT
jgi:hypothetical protein